MKDFNQKQWDKIYSSCDMFADIANNALDNNLSKKNYFLYAFNIQDIAIYHIEKGLLLWRVGQSPIKAFSDALDTFETFRKAACDYELKPRPSWENRSVVMSLIAYLLGKDIPHGVNADYEQWLDEAKKVDPGAHNNFLYANRYLCDVIKTGHSEAISNLESELDKLSSLSGFALFFATHRNYLELLTCQDQNRIDGLVQTAEKNYLKRKKDKQMDGSIYGGGLDNPYMVDFMLGAILKKINWQGQSRHKWLWD